MIFFISSCRFSLTLLSNHVCVVHFVFGQKKGVQNYFFFFQISIRRQRKIDKMGSPTKWLFVVFEYTLLSGFFEFFVLYYLYFASLIFSFQQNAFWCCLEHFFHTFDPVWRRRFCAINGQNSWSVTLQSKSIFTQKAASFDDKWNKLSYLQNDSFHHNPNQSPHSLKNWKSKNSWNTFCPLSTYFFSIAEHWLIKIFLVKWSQILN